MVLSYQEMASEFLAVMHWDEAARVAYAKALRSYQRAGAPSVPMNAVNYRSQFAKQNRPARRVPTKAMTGDA